MASQQAFTGTLARWKSPLQSVLLIALAVALVGAAVLIVGYDSFSGFSIWDDEGDIMIGLRSFLQGSVLYDSVYAQYGPFYYLIEGAIYAALRAPVNHNDVRGLMAIWWIVSAGLCSWTAYRLTRSWILTALGFAAANRLTVFFKGSPGHPEEICLVLLLGILLCSCYLSERRTGGFCIVLGCLLGALILTKINIGAYATLAIALALVRASPSARMYQALFAMGAGTAVLMPGVVMASLLNQSWAKQTVLFLMLSIAAALLVSWSSQTEPFLRPALFLRTIAGFLGSCSLVIGVVLAKGTTLQAMFNLTVLQYREFAENWFVAFTAGPLTIPALSLIASIGWIVAARRPKLRGPVLIALNVLKVALIVFWCWQVWSNSPALIYNFTIPWTWLVLVPSTPSYRGTPTFARITLCLLSVLTALYLLPVAGTQLSFSVILTIPVVCVWLDDTRSMLALWSRGVPLLRAAEVLIAGLALLSSLYWAASARHTYHVLFPLRLTGAERIHVPKRKVAEYLSITKTLQRSCETNFSMPGIFSLYFWTGQEPPTRLLMNNWIGLVSNRDKEQIVADLSHFDKLCVVYNQDLVEFWRRGQDLSASPLARYIHEGFVPLKRVGHYVILVRAGRADSLP
jgi:hypothetical protein